MIRGESTPILTELGKIKKILQINTHSGLSNDYKNEFIAIDVCLQFYPKRMDESEIRKRLKNRHDRLGKLCLPYEEHMNQWQEAYQTYRDSLSPDERRKTEESVDILNQIAAEINRFYASHSPLSEESVEQIRDLIREACAIIDGNSTE